MDNFIRVCSLLCRNLHLNGIDELLLFLGSNPDEVRGGREGWIDEKKRRNGGRGGWIDEKKRGNGREGGWM